MTVCALIPLETSCSQFDPTLAFAQSNAYENVTDPLAITGFIHWQQADLDNFQDIFPDWYQLYIGSGAGSTPSIANGPVRPDRGVNAMFKLQGQRSSLILWHRESSRSSGEGGFTPDLKQVSESIWHDRTTVLEAKNLFTATDSLQLESALSINKYEIDPESRYVFNAGADNALFLQDWKYGSGLGANSMCQILIWNRRQ